ncbi:uncharacterized protein LOC117381964 [Periophthalmus magnuspinnatus]|uniref:uncharacterized protein LOC117381964 n=1 Tax=Periophthalmus magnuspinnatus TaxID=409849 RepID=UPI00243650B7|nr:uncharacterized protein LOC117381964 [Periophthalmus magnuspinnatus]
MGYDIGIIKYVTSTIISNLVGTENEPLVYILVTFNDPDFGPVIKTTNLTTFKKAINDLSLSGGGDGPEKSLSGLQLALSAVPIGSEIYVFTDAAAKDANLKNSIITLIEITQCVVNFVISEETLQEPNYMDVAKASGGQVVKVSNDNIYQAIQVFLDSSFSNLVTLLQTARNPGKSESFTFSVDETDTRLRVFITGTKTFTFTSPSVQCEAAAAHRQGALSALESRVDPGREQRTGAALGTTDAAVGSVFLTWKFMTYFGPLMRTTDANEFKKAINALTPNGGGDLPEMSLSGLQLGLTGAPFDSEIYLFTDAAAKDSHLKSTVAALIEKTGSVVNFMITSSTSLRRRRSNSGNQRQFAPRQAVTEFQVYNDLAAASGGQAVEMSKNQLLEAINVVLETSTSSVVTLLQVVRNPGKSDNVTFTVDDTVTDLTIYITGTNKDFILISPTGVAQESTTTNGSLFTSVVVGNLQALMLNTEVGLWEIRMVSTNSYSLKITGMNRDMIVNAVVDEGCALLRILISDGIFLLLQVTDVTRPVCELLSLRDNCTETCGNSTWQLSVRLSDGVNGTGIVRVYHRQGNGTLNTTVDANDTVASYEASCCSPTVEIIAVDAVGSLGYQYPLFPSEEMDLAVPSVQHHLQL